MSDRSLDEFIPEEPDSAIDAAPETAEQADDADGETAGTAEQTASDRVDPATVDPASPTAGFTPGGAACAACGESVKRGWQQDGDLVCRDCKEW